MCNRYVFDETNELPARFDVDVELVDIKPNFNVAPTQTMPVITNEEGKNTLELMRWGIPRFIGPGKVKDVFNTRADKAFWSWKKLTMTQRALIPATGFYEWRQQAGGKQPFFIHPKDEHLFSFAGVWNIWKNDEGHEIKVYSIVTTEPNHEMSGIHNRMPVILHKSDEQKWLSHGHDHDKDFLEQLLLPYDDSGLEIYKVSTEVNSVKNNNPQLMAKSTTD
jgi:putative SOS response-associated peptidase YedK